MKIAFTYLRLLKLSWKQYRLRFDVILFSHLCFILPLNIAFDLAQHFQLVTISVGTIGDVLKLWQNPWFLGIQLLSTVANLWISVCVMLTIKTNYQQELPSFAEIIRRSWKYFPRVLIATVLINVFALLGLSLFVIPGLIVWFACSLSLPALIWKDLSPLKAIQLSWKTVKRYWWIAPGYIFITLLILVTIGIVITSLIPSSLGFSAASTTIAGIIQSFVTIVVMVLFVLLEEVSTVTTQPEQAA